jgi:hypothetical protein
METDAIVWVESGFRDDKDHLKTTFARPIPDLPPFFLI